MNQMATVLSELDSYVYFNYPELHSITVLQGGKTLHDAYYGGRGRDLLFVGSSEPFPPRSAPYPTGFEPNQVHNVKSVTKSVMSCLIGIAFELGILAGPEQTIADVLKPGVWSGVDPAKKRITLGHLLTMRSGFDWHENAPDSLRWIASGNPIEFTLHEQRLIAEPGGTWNYSTADVHLLSACLTQVTGRPALDFAEEHLFEPLDFGAHRWIADPQGLNIGGSELILTPRDMARFGLLYLHGGVEDGRQIVPRRWVELTTGAIPTVDAQAIQASMQVVWPSEVRYYYEGYGWLWWRTTLGGHTSYFAAGYGGQLIAVVPDLDVVVVETASTDRPPSKPLPPEESFPGLRLIERFVIPAVARPT